MHQRGARPHGYGKSEHTVVKQRMVAAITAKQMYTVCNIQRKRGLYAGDFWFFDWYAGPGIDDDGDAGSSVIARDLALQVGLRARLFSCEQDRMRAAHLARALPESWAQVACGDCTLLVPAYVSAWSAAMRAAAYGILYLDPNEALLPWNILGTVAGLLPHVEVMIHLGAGNLKRVRTYYEHHAHETLSEGMRQVPSKPSWFISEPTDSQHWCMLLASRWPRQQGIAGLKLYPVASERGQAFFRKANYTEEERKHVPERGQLPLFGVE